MATYHLELRSFPRQCLRFNQSGTDVGAIVLPWVQDRVFEIDGEKWAPYDSQITILEGPPIPLERLSMGRGWSAAQREGTDVTDRVLSEARTAIADGSVYVQRPPEEAPVPPTPEPRPSTSDYPSLAGQGAAPLASAGAETPPEPASAAGVEELLGEQAPRLLAAWRAVAARTGGLAPSESLALAERDLQREDRDQA